MNRYLFEMMLHLINEQLDAQEDLLTERTIKLPSGSTRPKKISMTKAQRKRLLAFKAFMAYLKAPIGSGGEGKTDAAPKKPNLKPWTNENVVYITNMGPYYERNDIIDNLTGSSGVTYGGWNFKIDPNDLDKYKRNSNFNIGGSLTASSGSNSEIFQIRFKQGGTGGNTSELFEGNLIIALNNMPFPPSQGTDLKFINDSKVQNIAYGVFANITGSGLGTELVGKTYSKPGNAGDLTAIYKYYGVTSKTPKTDIASNDKTLRISAKKKGGSLLTSEFNQTKAIIAVALLNKYLRDGFRLLRRDSDLFTDVKTELEREAPDGQKLTVANRGTNALNVINEFVIKNHQNNNFKEAFLLEAMTGNKKFTDDLSKANRLLFWDENGAGDYHNINVWVKENYDKATFRSRFRGGTRSTGFGVDPGKLTETPNEEINEFRMSGNKFDPEIQIDLERPVEIPDQKINEFILTAIGYSLKEVDPESNTVTIGDPDPQQQKELETMVQKMLEPFDKQPQKEPKIPDNVVALDPKDVKSTKDDEEIEIDVKDDEQEKQAAE